jgi:NADH dehydrogenase FAD-containing subunit
MAKLVLAGAGHVHLTVLKKLREIVASGHEVAVIGPSEHHYYSGMGPGMLGGMYGPDAIRFPVKLMTESGGGKFITDEVVSVDAEKKRLLLRSGDEIAYDVLSLNLGSRITAPPGAKGSRGERSVFPVKPIENLRAGRRRVLMSVHSGPSVVGVLGGGPAAAEVAANAWRAARECLRAKGGRMPEIKIFAGRSFLGRYPGNVARLARKSLEDRGVVINEGGYVEDYGAGELRLENGETHRADPLFLALGTEPPKLIAESGLPVGPDGGLAVDRYLRCTAHPEIFGGGDCIHFTPRPLAKVGVHAVKQNPVLFDNLRAALEGGELGDYRPQEKYMLIFNMGDGKGLLWKGGFACLNRPSFWLKDYIDRKFMREFKPGR